MGPKKATTGGLAVAAAAGAAALLAGGLAAWARRPKGGEAPGHPGAEPRWYRSKKSGVGTAINPDEFATSLVWFTIADGILSEVFYPRVDWACTRDLGLIVTDGREFFSPEAEAAEHRVEYLAEGVPAYRLINTCNQGRYRIEKTILAHPRQNSVLQRTTFTPLEGRLEDYHLYALLAPHLDNVGASNTAWVGEHRGVPALLAQRSEHALALIASEPWLRGSAGFVGRSDGWQDLHKHKQMIWEYDRAEDGNVALTGEIDLKASGGTFTLALGFGPQADEAGHRALASLLDDFDELLADYNHAWRDWQGSLREIAMPDGQGRDLYRISTMVLRTHADEGIPGALIASLSTPWGASRGDEEEHGTGGYHLVWPRDLVESAVGLSAAGGHKLAGLVLRYLQATQLVDGHWPQNMWVSSGAYWTGNQLGETAFPILLLDGLRRDSRLRPGELARYWPMVRRAVSSIVRSGPATQQDRWENQRGYTPFTLGVVISALLAAAEIADDRGEATIARHLRETADAWNSAIESWLYVKDTELAHRVGVEGYYVRTVLAELNESTPRMGHARVAADARADPSGLPVVDVVSVDALALVRFGLRAPDDPRILNTIKVIDAELKVETPSGPSWHRYSGDGYGEHPDGRPYALKGPRGVGRAWPLLTGERGHYELIAGHRAEAVRLLHAMAAFADQGGMIPEQVWDTDDIPAHDLFKGQPTGSATPLVWAHAEYLKLRRSIQDGRPFDLPPQTVKRYLVEKVGSDLVIWQFDHRRGVISPGETLRVEVLESALVRWSGDGGRTNQDIETRDTGLNLHIADLPTTGIPVGGDLRFTFHWRAADRWEGEEFKVRVVDPHC